MSAARHHTILVVEDEGIVRMDIADCLRAAGFDVVEAVDSAGALEAVESRRDIALMFTDINMPGTMNGLELARRVHESHPQIQLILTSGAVKLSAQDIPDDGAFISKPYRPEVVAETAERLLA